MTIFGVLERFVFVCYSYSRLSQSLEGNRGLLLSTTCLSEKVSAVAALKFVGFSDLSYNLCQTPIYHEKAARNILCTLRDTKTSWDYRLGRGHRDGVKVPLAGYMLSNSTSEARGIKSHT